MLVPHTPTLQDNARRGRPYLCIHQRYTIGCNLQMMKLRVSTGWPTHLPILCSGKGELCTLEYKYMILEQKVGHLSAFYPRMRAHGFGEAKSLDHLRAIRDI